MDLVFEVKTSKNNLEAYLVPKHIDRTSMPPEKLLLVDEIYDKSTKEDLISFLNQNNIRYGFLEEEIDHISSNFRNIMTPIVVAKGKEPINGRDGYLEYEFKDFEEDYRLDDEKVTIDFRQLNHIANVRNGDLIATYHPPTKGLDGTNVFGKTIAHKNGKRLTIKLGKNVKMLDNAIYATVDGQIKKTDRSVDVNPVFQVNGDLDMKTGNINFVGNVCINGAVGRGFVIQAGGDVTINGLVDNSSIIAKGNIVVKGGILGGPQTRIETQGNLKAHYLNGVNVVCKGDILIENSIIQSNCRCFGKIICEKGSIYGGKISCIEGLLVENLGNDLFIKTEVFIGVDQTIVTRAIELKEKLILKNEEASRLKGIVKKLLEFKRTQGKLDKRQTQLINMQKNTYDSLQAELRALEKELKEFEGFETSCKDAYLACKNSIFPNVTISFGKYATAIKVVHTHVRVKLVNNEISILPF